MNADLPPKQRETLLYVLEVTCSRQRPPTWREMMAHFGVSFNAITQRVERLAARGWLYWPEGCRSGGAQAAALRVRGARYEVAPRRRLRLLFAPDADGWRLACLLANHLYPGAFAREAA